MLEALAIAIPSGRNLNLSILLAFFLVLPGFCAELDRTVAHAGRNLFLSVLTNFHKFAAHPFS